METIRSYRNLKGNIVTQDFSSHASIVEWSLERIEALAHLSLKEQLKELSIHQVIVTSEINAEGQVIPDVHRMELSFRIKMLLEPSRGMVGPERWPLTMGHELAHTYFFKKGFLGFYRANLSIIKREMWQGPDIEEVICETFGEMWLRRRSNFTEVYELLAPITHGGVVNIY